MDPFTLAIGIGIAWAFLSGGKKKNGRAPRVCEARMDKFGTMVEFVWDEAMNACIPTKAFVPPDDYDEDDYDKEENGSSRFDEPDYKPGPIDKKKLVVPDVDEEEDDSWVADLSALITEQPTPEHFYQVYKDGPLASTIAGQVLAARGINTGSNRVALIKCMTQIAWNWDRYASTRVAESWGTMFNVDGRNLSAAWMPRHDPAMQLLAMKKRVPRNINEAGAWLGGSAKYGLIWIPRIESIQGKVICNPAAESPPAWLLSQLTD